MIAIFITTNGRDSLLRQTIESLKSNLPDISYEIFLVDDCPNRDASPFPRIYGLERCHLALVEGQARGFCGAIQAAWDDIKVKNQMNATSISYKYIFHLEDDFTFNEEIPIYDMIQILDTNPHLAQVALKRQPWSPQEQVAGGIVECWPEEFRNKSMEVDGRIIEWCEHDLFFTTNPCMYRIDLLDLGWPQCAGSEMVFTQILKEKGYSFSYFGHKLKAPMVTHIGTERVGNGY